MGSAKDLDTAKAEFKVAWEELKARTSPAAFILYSWPLLMYFMLRLAGRRSDRMPLALVAEMQERQETNAKAVKAADRE